MEVVASRVDQLEKSKIVPVQPQPVPPPKPKPKKRKSETAYAEWDVRKYKGTGEERRKDREKRRLLREAKQKEKEEELARKIQQLQPLGEDDGDEQEMEEPPEQPTSAQQEKATDKKETPAARNKCYELERRRKDKAAREAEKAKASKQAEEELQKSKSPARKKGKSPGRGKAKTDQKQTDKSTPGTSKPKVKSPERAKPKVKSPGRQSSKTKDKKDDDATDQTVATKEAKKPTKKDDDAISRKVTPKSTTTKHVDDDEYELDLKTGKFVKKKKQKVAVQDDDDDIEMEEIDDEDKDKDYDPEKDADQGDDDDEEQEIEDEEDDFQIPPIRSKKQTGKGSDKSTSHTKQKQTSKEALEDLADFVEETFKKPTRQSTRKTKTHHDACINPLEAARFQKAMRDEAVELEKAVRKGRNVAAAYETLVTHVVQACKDMKYDIPADLEAQDIFPTIEDPDCKAWQLKMQGIQTAGEGELNVSKADNSGVCVAKKKFALKDVMAYVEEVSSDWTELKRKNFILTMKKVMGNMTIAHRMVADASQEMINLLDEIDLPLWMKLADITMRPLVHLEVPEITIMCEEAKQISKANEQSWDQTTKITTIMEGRCLPFLPTAWGYDREGRAKKVIAGIIYKYVKDRMYEGKIETPATEVSEKFGFNATTMNRHILGKKYVGGKASGSGTARKPAAVKRTAAEQKNKSSEDGPSSSRKSKSTERPVDKSTAEDDEDLTTPKSKGKGKSSGTKRPAQVIRDESKSEQEKQKAKKRKEEQQLEEEEDEDRPTQEEIKKSGPPKKHISIR